MKEEINISRDGFTSGVFKAESSQFDKRKGKLGLET
jgi:hypothetical protein